MLSCSTKGSGTVESSASTMPSTSAEPVPTPVLYADLGMRLRESKQAVVSQTRPSAWDTTTVYGDGAARSQSCTAILGAGCDCPRASLGVR